jgi:hypothetical protein
VIDDDRAGERRRDIGPFVRILKGDQTKWFDAPFDSADS